ncbi:MAG: glycine-rich domain-containing protein [Bacillota bacterium]
MALDPVRNFASEFLLSAGITASATSITLTVDPGSKIPNPSTEGSYNMVIYNKTDFASPEQDPSVEIYRVIGKSGATLTVQRGQEGTAAVAHNTTGKTYAVLLPITAKMISDIAAQLPPVSTASNDFLVGNGTSWLVKTIVQVKAILGLGDAAYKSIGTTSGTVCAGNDSRLSDSRTPNAHASTHKSGGTDVIKLDELGAPTDTTANNASTAAHGLLPKLPNDATKFLNGNGSWASPGGGGGMSRQVFTADGAFTVPEGITKLYVEVVGGGGGGGYNYGGGGGGGAYASGFIDVTPGAQISVIVGNGGLGSRYGQYYYDGDTGGQSKFGNFLIANGGEGGKQNYSGSNSTSMAIGGSGGTANQTGVNAPLLLQGSNGGFGSILNYDQYGGIGAPGLFGMGAGRGGYQGNGMTQYPVAGVDYTGAGGGGGTQSQNGANGGKGVVIVYY